MSERREKRWSFGLNSVAAMVGVCMVAACTEELPSNDECMTPKAGCPCATSADCGGLTCCAMSCRDTSTDAMNCGACGSRCSSAPNGSVECVAGSCQIVKCETGHLDCDGRVASGCEADAMRDGEHCGACSVRCEQRPHQSVSCVGGTCKGECSSGFAHCSSDDRDGCEVNIDSDTSNCGSCKNACPPGKPFCNHGQCSETGCLAGGLAPPKLCDRGFDRVYATPWVVCAADCDSAWLSYGMPGGGRFYPLQVCQSLGYSNWSGWDGSFGSICGTNQGETTTCAQPGTPSFTMPIDKPNKGSDKYGAIIGETVEWRCIR